MPLLVLKDSGISNNCVLIESCVIEVNNYEVEFNRMLCFFFH